MSEAIAAGGSGVVHSAMTAMTGGITESEVRAHRVKLGVHPVFKRIDSCAADSTLRRLIFIRPMRRPCSARLARTRLTSAIARR